MSQKELTALFLSELRAGRLPSQPHGFKGALEFLLGNPKPQFDTSPSESEDSDEDTIESDDYDYSLDPFDLFYKSLRDTKMLSQTFLEEDVANLPLIVRDCRHEHPLALTYHG